MSIDELNEKSPDELWELAQNADATPDGTDAASVNSDELPDIPDDDSDLLGDAAFDPIPDAAPVSENAPPFDVEAVFPQFAEKFQREVLPQFQSQAVEEAMRRMKQSQKQRDENIKEQLKPLMQHLARLEQSGVYTREDSQREYNAAYQAASSEIDQREQAQQQATMQQQWLERQKAQTQQASAPEQTPTWITATADAMSRTLEQSGLTEDDPEFANIPLNVTHDNPLEAYDYFKGKVASAVEAKQQRLQASAKPKPLIDMGMGGNAGGGNPLAGIEDPDELWKRAGI